MSNYVPAEIILNTTTGPIVVATKASTDARFLLIFEALHVLLMKGSGMVDGEELARVTGEVGKLREDLLRAAGR